MLLLGYISALASSMQDAVQLRHTLRTKSLSGISPITRLSYLLSCPLWLIYGMRLGDGPLMLSAAISTAIAATMALLIYRNGAAPAAARIACSVVLYAALGVLIWHSLPAGVLMLASVDILFFLPQLKEALLRTDLSGISPAAVLLELASSIGWVSYTIMADIPAAGAFSAVYSLLLGAVAWKLLLFRRANYGRGRT